MMIVMTKLKQNNTINHVMIDIETWGNEMDAVICSISAVMFDIETGETGDIFHSDIKAQSCIDAGLSVSASTVLWWMQQSEDARRKMVGGQVRAINLDSALYSLSEWYGTFAMDCKVWGNGAKFDLGIITSAYKAVGMPLPWNHWDEMDVRTMNLLRPKYKKTAKFEGVPHYGVDDCKHQIKYICGIYRDLNPVKHTSP